MCKRLSFSSTKEAENFERDRKIVTKQWKNINYELKMKWILIEDDLQRETVFTDILRQRMLKDDRINLKKTINSLH
jgi:hypothetical protein